jgi:hypothetical protein
MAHISAIDWRNSLPDGPALSGALVSHWEHRTGKKNLLDVYQRDGPETYAHDLQALADVVFPCRGNSFRAITMLSMLSGHHSNSHVFLGHTKSLGLVVVKDHIHAVAPWHVPMNTVAEIDAHIDIHTNPLLSSHPNLRRCTGVLITAEYTRLVFEFIPLTYMFFDSGTRPWTIVSQWVHSLLTVVGALHSAGRAHRDIKIGNLCFRSNGSLVLFDFDSSALHSRTESCAVCTITYRAPEAFQGIAYDTQLLDAWSVGCCVLELVLSEPLYTPRQYANDETIRKATESLIEEVAAGTSQRMRDFVAIADKSTFIDIVQRLICEVSTRATVLSIVHNTELRRRVSFVEDTLIAVASTQR